MDVRRYFAGKKITVMGLGLLGRGVGDVRFLAECGAEVIVTDLKTREQLASSVALLQGFPNITFVLGEHRLEDFCERDLILKAPKTPADSRYITEARSHNIPITMSTALFAKLAQAEGATIVGVTGTRGKTTTTEMVGHILREAGKSVLLGGNIRGVSTLALLPEVTSHTIAVLELDSWQLQGFYEENISPHIAVFTTFYPDHMDYYHGDMQAYLEDKAQIFLHQNPSDILILGEQIQQQIQKTYASRIRAKVQVADSSNTAPFELSIPGTHNQQNALCATLATVALGVSETESRTALTRFTGVSGRLEKVREVKGVSFYNDTTATTPEATIAALRALGNNKNIILLMGGSDKGLDMNELLLEIPKRTKRVIMLSGSGTNRVLPFIPDASVFDSLSGALEEAVRYAVSGDVILLSPAFASFGMFTNEYDRGDQFIELVQAL